MNTLHSTQLRTKSKQPVDRSLKVYTLVARERVVVTQDSDAELSFVSSGRRVALGPPPPL